MDIHTFYLLVAALFQVCWLYNIKAIDKKKLSAIRPGNIFTAASLLALLPVILYVVFGIANVTFLTKAVKDNVIAASTAYAIWTGIVLAIASLIDKFYFRQRVSSWQYVFLLLIAVGIIGLKFSTKNM